MEIAALVISVAAAVAAAAALAVSLRPAAGKPEQPDGELLELLRVQAERDEQFYKLMNYTGERK